MTGNAASRSSQDRALGYTMTDATRLAPPGDIAHFNRLIEAWARSNPESFTELSQGRRSTPGRLRRLIGVRVIAAALDGFGSDERLL